jgi:hypothetical protein
LKLKKCHFFKKELKFLGHIISKEGIKPDPEKVKAVQDWPIPSTQSDVRAFLGLTNYFKRFIKGYSKVAAPLTDLTKKNQQGSHILFTKECIHAFEELKRRLVTAPLLAVPDFQKPFRMVTDASKIGIGGVLLQDGRPCAFESRKLSPAEQNYHTTERELLAVVHCLQKWNVYMRGNSDSIIETDHAANTYFQTKASLSSREARWLETLSSFPGKWVYKPGQTNIADPLSRMPTFYMNFIGLSPYPVKTLLSLHLQPREQDNLLAKLRESTAKDTSLEKVKEYTYENELYYSKDGKIVVPDDEEIRTMILEQCHDSLFSGHMGRDKTTELVKRMFYWKNMDKYIADYVKSCHICQTTKPAPTQNQGRLTLPSIGMRPWYEISVDLITGLPKAKSGHDAILTIVDRLTKMVHLVKTHSTLDAQGFAQLFKDHVYSKHGLPGDVLSDRDPRFTGHFWREVSGALGQNLSFTSAFHPQSDGQTERMNRTIEQVLRAHAAQYDADWDLNLSMVEFCMNNTHHAALKHTPFFLNSGQHPITPIMWDFIRQSKSSCPAAMNFTHRMQETLQLAKQNLQHARDRYKSYADNQRKDIQFALGQDVLLSTVNLNKMGQKRKLFPRWLGPFRVTEIINDVAYRLDLPPSMKIHNVFHVALLKPYVYGKRTPPPVPIEVRGELEFEVEKILDHKEHVSAKGKNLTKHPVQRKFLVKWKGYTDEHNTWESEASLKHAPDALARYWRSLDKNPKNPSKALAPAAPRGRRKTGLHFSALKRSLPNEVQPSAKKMRTRIVWTG